MLDTIIVVASIASILMLGVVVLARNSRDRTYQLFGLLTGVSILWFLTNYSSDYIHGYSSQLFANKLSFSTGILLIVSLWMLSLYFPRKTYNHKIQRKFTEVVAPVIIAVTLFTNIVVRSVSYSKVEQLTTVNTGNYYPLIIIAMIVFFGFLLNNFYRSYKSKELNSLQRQQLLYAATGMLLAFLWGILSAALIPAMTHNWAISKLSAASSLFIIVPVSYSMIAHKLFDIRLVVARAVGYVFTLATVSAIFIAPTLLLTITFLHTPLPLKTIVSLVVITIIVATLFQYLKNKFNKVTNKFFYRDYYDIQDVLDELGNLLVRSVDPDEILANSSSILSKAAKPMSFRYLLINEYEKYKVDDEKIIKTLSRVKSNIVILDEYDSHKQHGLYEILLSSGIALTVRLRTKSDELGYMLLGFKQSGQIYSDTDKRLLTIAADEIAISLQNALRFEEIQQFNVTLQQKVDEATLKLRRANDKLRALDETKDDFISMASHQLRTPLTSVKGYISMVLDGDVGKLTKSQKDMLNQAFFSSQRMVYLIADLLNVSRLKTGKFVIEPSPVNLAEVVQQELSQLGETASSKSLKLIYDKPKTFPTLMLDDTKTRQVIMNFVDNAIYYTPSGGEIHVKLIDNPSSIELRVEDNGIGVPKSEQHHLFTKFYRAGNARKARPDGTGLGLFMAKKVILAEGGSIIFESTEGKGSTFGFVFSKSKLTPKDTGPIPVKQPDKQEELVAA